MGAGGLGGLGDGQFEITAFAGGKCSYFCLCGYHSLTNFTLHGGILNKFHLFSGVS